MLALVGDLNQVCLERIEALVRSNLHTDFEGKEDEQIYQLTAQAYYIEAWRMNNLATVITKLFGSEQ